MQTKEQRIDQKKLHFSSSNDVSDQDNLVEINTEIWRKAELELTGVSIEQTVRFGGEIRGEEAMVFQLIDYY